MRVEKSPFDMQQGFNYYLCFKPAEIFDAREIHCRLPIAVTISVGETADLADVSFEIPKGCRSQEALEYVCANPEVKYVDPWVFVSLPEHDGDTVLPAAANLDMDVNGRILGIEIQWSPADESQLA